MASARGDGRLRRVRIALAILASLPLAAGFLDIGLLPAPLAQVLPRTQLLPAFLALPAMTAVVAVVVVAVLTLAFGRVYCSTLCPLGTLQDIVIRLSTTRRRRHRFRFAPPATAVHLGVAAVALGGALSTNLVLLVALEPYSAVGRALVGLVRPAIVEAVNALSGALAIFHVYAVAPVQMPVMPVAAIVLCAVWVAGVVALAHGKGRLFCNLLCPTGALLRIATRFSWWSIGIEKGRCTGCGVCERICKARCIDASRQHVA